MRNPDVQDSSITVHEVGIVRVVFHNVVTHSTYDGVKK